MFYQGTWQFVQHSASFCFRPWSKDIQGHSTNKTRYLWISMNWWCDSNFFSTVIYDDYDLACKIFRNHQRNKNNKHQVIAHHFMIFYHIFEWSNDCWICWWKKICSTWHYKKPLENLGCTTGTSSWWCRIAVFLFPTFFSIAVMGMFGLIELSELVARYSEGKSQGLSFCQVLNLPVRNGSDNGCIWTLRTWKDILTTKN